MTIQVDLASVEESKTEHTQVVLKKTDDIVMESDKAGTEALKEGEVTSREESKVLVEVGEVATEGEAKQI